MSTYMYMYLCDAATETRTSDCALAKADTDRDTGTRTESDRWTDGQPHADVHACSCVHRRGMHRTVPAPGYVSHVPPPTPQPPTSTPPTHSSALRRVALPLLPFPNPLQQITRSRRSGAPIHISTHPSTHPSLSRRTYLSLSPRSPTRQTT